METVSDIFDVFSGPAAVARLLHVKPSTAGEMKRRGSIPSEYWQDLLLVAKQRRIVGLDAERLVALHARAARLHDAGKAAPAIHVLPEAEGSSASDGQFSRFKHLRRPHFSSSQAVSDHVSALRDEWSHR